MLKPIVYGAACLCLATAASATTMTFDEVTGNYTPFDDTIGDSAHVDVSNSTRSGFGNSAQGNAAVLHWASNYSELQDVAFAAFNGGVGQLSFMIDPGYEMTIDSFRMGNYFNGNSPRNASFRIYDAGWNQVWSNDVTGHTGNSILISPNVTLSGTAYFQWGTDWNTGIDDFAYTARASNVSVIPLPAGLPLLLTGIAGFAGLSMRKKRKA